jgi:hypothetical protein
LRTVRAVAASVCRRVTSAISRFLLLINTCWRTLSMLNPRNSGCV